MPDRIITIQKNVLTWWGKYTTKQKTMIVSVAALVIFTFAILITVLTKPTYVTLITCSTTKEASEVKKLLEDEGITNKVSDNGMIVSVLKDDISDATLLLGANSIPADGYSIDNVFSNGFSATEQDKNKKYKLYLEDYIAKNLEGIDSIKKASVQLSLPNSDGIILSKEQDTYVSVILTLDGKLESEAANAIAKSLATAVGNNTADHILIIDSNGNLLFSGEDKNTISGNASTQLAAKTQAENVVKNEVRNVMLGTNLYDNVEVSSNLSMNFSVIDQTEHTYSPAEGQSQGLLGSESISETETTGGGGSTPGTDANDGTGTTYLIDNGNGTTSSSSTENRQYLPNEKVTNTQIPPGAIDYDKSSISVVAAVYKVYSESDLRNQGALDNITYAEFRAQNSQETKTDVDPDLYNMVAKATGIAEENISIIAYEVPFFQEQEAGRNITDYLLMGLISVVLGVLGFVVFRSIRKVSVRPEENELSVENLLAATKEQAADMEDIDINSKSEVRLMLEKFVDENSESVAQLMRNWLNEDWK